MATKKTDATDGENTTAEWDAYIDGRIKTALDEYDKALQEKLTAKFDAVEKAEGVTAQDLNDALATQNKTVMDGVDAKIKELDVQGLREDVQGLKTDDSQAGKGNGASSRLSMIEQAPCWGSAPGDPIPGLTVDTGESEEGLDLKPEKR